MNRRSKGLLVAVVTASAVVAALATVPLQANASSFPWPRRFSSSVSTTTPGVVTISWKPKGAIGSTHTTRMKIETGLTQFSPFTKSLPTHGRHSHVFSVKWSGKKRGHFTLGAKRLAAAGASMASGNVIYYRLFSVNKHHKKKHVRSDGHLHTAFVRGVAPKGAHSLSIGGYNIRSATLDLHNSHNWFTHRVDPVAANIADAHPGIVTLAEALTSFQSPYPDSQLKTLVDALNRRGMHYAPVRTTFYDRVPGSNQGMRILYDTTKYKLVDKCPDNAAGGTELYSKDVDASCSFKLPLLSTDGPMDHNRRWAAYAHLQQIDSSGSDVGSPFWVVAVHLDSRRDPNHAAVQKKYNILRRDQMATVLAKMNTMTNGQPLIISGDFNDWQNDQAPWGNSAHDYLVAHGFYDTAAAQRQVNLNYSTVFTWGHNDPSGNGAGSRFDQILTRGIPGATSFKVRLKPGSDHNMVVATTKLP